MHWFFTINNLEYKHNSIFQNLKSLKVILTLYLSVVRIISDRH